MDREEAIKKMKALLKITRRFLICEKCGHFSTIAHGQRWCHKCPGEMYETVLTLREFIERSIINGHKTRATLSMVSRFRWKHGEGYSDPKFKDLPTETLRGILEDILEP